MLTCTGCRLMHYCNTDCQRNDWPRHKDECKRLREVRKAARKGGRATGLSDTEAQRLVLRHLNQGRTDEAEAECRYRISTSSSSTWHNLLGLTRSKKGNTEGAIEAFSSGLIYCQDTKCRAVLLFNLGNQQARLGNRRKAIESFTLAAEADPLYLKNRVKLAHFLVCEENYQGAMEHLRAAIQISPRNAKVHYFLADVLHECKDYSQAVDSYRRAVQLFSQDGSEMEHDTMKFQKKAFAGLGGTLYHQLSQELHLPSRHPETAEYVRERLKKEFESKRCLEKTSELSLANRCPCCTLPSPSGPIAEIDQWIAADKAMYALLLRSKRQHIK